MEPLKGVSKLNDNCLRVLCECMTPEHSVDCWIEVEHAFDDGPDLISITHYVTIYSKPFDNIWQRIKSACNILFKGVDEKQHEILLTDEAARNWINAVNQKLTITEKYKSEKRND